MDSAVHLVQSYLRVNGYFTVAEYPVVDMAPDYRAATDLDLLAVRFPGAGRVIPGEGTAEARRHAPFAPDPVLDVAPDRTDMIVAEVKEGRAEFNEAGLRPAVLAAGLTRFGCCAHDRALPIAEELARSGQAASGTGHRIRLVAFGGVDGRHAGSYRRISLGHVLRYLERWVDEHWVVLQRTQSKDPVLGFLMTLAKARRRGPDGGGLPDHPRRRDP